MFIKKKGPFAQQLTGLGPLPLPLAALGGLLARQDGTFQSLLVCFQDRAQSDQPQPEEATEDHLSGADTTWLL